MAFFAHNAVLSSNRAIFRDVTLNHGNAYNADTGRFTAPLGGVYVFHLFYQTQGGNNVYLGIQVNGNDRCAGEAHDFESVSCSAIVRLEQGHVVSVSDIYSPRSPPLTGIKSGFSGFLYFAL